jgi:hypothetical protein
MSLRSTFHAFELAELERRLGRVRLDRPQHWLDDFPEFWLARGSSFHRGVTAARVEVWAESAAGVRCAHLFETMSAEPGAWSYLCASILYRRLHGEWSPQGPAWLTGAPAPEILRRLRPAREVPADWRPHVIEDNTQIRVAWYSLKGPDLFLYEDLYRSEGLDFSSKQRLLARRADC